MIVVFFLKKKNHLKQNDATLLGCNMIVLSYLFLILINIATHTLQTLTLILLVSIHSGR